MAHNIKVKRINGNKSKTKHGEEIKSHYQPAV